MAEQVKVRITVELALNELTLHDQIQFDGLLLWAREAFNAYGETTHVEINGGR